MYAEGVVCMRMEYVSVYRSEVCACEMLKLTLCVLKIDGIDVKVMFLTNCFVIANSLKSNNRI